MTDQTINNDNDIIQNVVDDSWQKGVCPPDWQRTHTEQYTEQYT